MNCNVTIGCSQGCWERVHPILKAAIAVCMTVMTVALIILLANVLVVPAAILACKVVAGLFGSLAIAAIASAIFYAEKQRCQESRLHARIRSHQQVDSPYNPPKKIRTNVSTNTVRTSSTVSMNNVVRDKNSTIIVNGVEY
jgi:hypothetical protein